MILFAAVLGVLFSFSAQAQVSDAIGVRVMKNPNHYSPARWYEWMGLKGSPQSLVIDGYEAVQDGNSIYVGAANCVNLDDSKADCSKNDFLYTNIYVISLSEEASAASQQVFDQFLNNFRFNINVPGLGNCSETTAQQCLSDADCGAGEYCLSEKAKITRDTKRMSDLQDIDKDLEFYYQTHKYCQLSPTKKPCVSDSGCSLSEGKCVNHYPFLDQGTYIRSMASSSWGSWQTVFGATLQNPLPEDPINKMASCKNPYDSITCWNPKELTYICPKGSYVYQYQSIGGSKVRLGADLEYIKDNLWIQGDDMSKFSLTNNCQIEFDTNGEISTTTEQYIKSNKDLCGDGLIGPNEVCDTAPRNYCDVLGQHDWYKEPQLQECASDCQSWVTPSPPITADTCGGYCGDSKVQADQGEICDLAAYPSKPNYPGQSSLNRQYDCDAATCRPTGGFCGDGSIQTANGEACEESTYATPKPKNSASNKQYACGRIGDVYIEKVAGGTPSAGSDIACLAARGGWCGDGKVQSQYGENCEQSDLKQCTVTKGANTYSGVEGKTCNNCVLSEWEACHTNEDCGDGKITGSEVCEVASNGTISWQGEQPTCAQQGWGTSGKVSCESKTCQYYGGGCDNGALSKGDIRIKLIWDTPHNLDFDSRLIIPDGKEGKVGYWDGDGEIEGSIFSDPFAYYAWDSKPTGCFDTSCHENDPEIITITTQNNGAYYSGWYKFYVNSYTECEGGDGSEGGMFSGSGAKVEIYVWDPNSPKNAKLDRTIYVSQAQPSGNSSSCNWYVFSMNNSYIHTENKLQTSVQ